MADRPEALTGTKPTGAGPTEAAPAEVQPPKLVKRNVSSASRRPVPTAPPKPKKTYEASIYPGAGSPMPADFAVAVQRLEADLKMPVWFLIQGGTGEYDHLGDKVLSAFMNAAKDLPKQPIALLIHSYGGYAVCSFQLARLLRRQCGGFTAVIPRQAKSAATQLALGAERIIMDLFGELGPLDTQVSDPDREGFGSALDEVQTLERLNAFSMQAVDELMYLLTARTRKRTDVLLPIVMHFISEMMRPLLEKIDTVHYTQMSRLLKVSEEYGVRLLQPKYSRDEARRIASHLVEQYTEHGFPIYAEEAIELGLPVVEASTRQSQLLEPIVKHLDAMTALGRIKEVVR
jgi:hypothetical protein